MLTTIKQAADNCYKGSISNLLVTCYIIRNAVTKKAVGSPTDCLLIDGTFKRIHQTPLGSNRSIWACQIRQSHVTNLLDTYA